MGGLHFEVLLYFSDYRSLYRSSENALPQPENCDVCSTKQNRIQDGKLLLIPVEQFLKNPIQVGPCSFVPGEIQFP